MASEHRESVPRFNRESLVSMSSIVATGARHAAKNMAKWVAMRPALPSEVQLAMDSLLLRAVIAAGNLSDDTLPIDFFRASMTTVSLEGASRLSAAVIHDSLLRCPRVEVLHLAGCFHLTDATLRGILSACPKVHTLTLEGCKKLSDVTIDTLIELAPNLTALDLGGCYNITLEGVRRLVGAHPLAASWTTLHISGLGVPGVDEALIKVIAAACPKLESIGLGYSQLTDGGLRELLSACKCARRLELHWCGSISDAGLGAIAELAPCIEVVTLTGCRGVSDEGMKALLRARAPAYAATFAEGTRLRRAAVRFTSTTDALVQHAQDFHPQVTISKT